MICFLCRNSALYRVGKLGFCREHRDAAIEVNRLNKRGIDAIARLRMYSQAELDERRQVMARANGWRDK